MIRVRYTFHDKVRDPYVITSSSFSDRSTSKKRSTLLYSFLIRLFLRDTKVNVY